MARRGSGHVHDDAGGNVSDDQTIPGGVPGAADSTAQFAADLRKLRLDADNPTLARLQADTGISRSVISDAFAGKQLPSARTVDGIARACGVDSSPWIDRRDALAGRGVAAAATDAKSTTAEDRAGAATRATVTRRAATLLAVGGFAVGVIASILTTILILPLLAPPAPAAASPVTGVARTPLIEVVTGEDPGVTECVEDARVATSATGPDNALLEILWSDQCQAGWARVTRYDSRYEGNTVTVAIYPQTAPDGPHRQKAIEHDVQGAYTTLVVRPSADTLLCAEGAYTVDGQTVAVADSLCI